MANIHTQAIPSEVLEQVNIQLDQIAQLLAPYLLSLTPLERKELYKMGDKTLSFVEKAGEYASLNPNLRPPYLNMEEYDIDMSDARSLRGLLIKVEQLRDGIDDTMMVAGGEALQASLIFYNSSNEAARHNVPGAKAIYDDLKARFPGRGVIPVPPAE